MNRYNTPVVFAMEQNLNTIFASVVFGATGVPTVTPLNSKGIANVYNQSLNLTASLIGSSTSVGSISSFLGLYNGMTVTGTGLQAGTTISSISATTNSFVLSKVASSTQNGVTVSASGGRYIFQFGLNVGNRLDPYYKLLFVANQFFESSASASGSLTTNAFVPAAPDMFVVSNNTSRRTIPATATSGSTDCSVIVQFGNFIGNSFIAADPAGGEILQMQFVMGNSSAI